MRFKVTLITAILSLFVFYAKSKQLIRKVCVDAISQSASITLNNYTDTCLGLKKVILFGYSKTNNAPIKIDSFTFLINNYSFNYQLKNVIYDSFFVTLIKNCNNIDNEVISIPKKSDLISPKEVLIDSISVINGKSFIKWKPNTEQDLRGYIIYRTSGVINNPIDTVYDLSQNFYIDNFIGDPKQGAVTYRISAIDSCGNNGNLGLPHTTNFITSTYNRCNNQIKIIQTGYKGWIPTKTILYILDIDSNIIKSQSFYGNEVIVSGIIDTSSYYFLVRAYRTNQSATSNILFKPKRNAKDYGYLELKSIQYQKDNKTLLVNGYADSIATKYKICVFVKEDNQYIFLDTLPYPTPTLFSFNKYQNLSNSPISFKFVIINECGLIANESNVMESIEPTLNIDDFATTISFNPINGFVNGAAQYQIYAYTLYPDISSINTVSSNTTDTLFIDTTFYNEVGNDGICYQIKAISNNGDTPNNPTPDTCISRIVCTPVPVKVYIPNAIYLNGINNTFKPISFGLDLSTSYYCIFDRWGSKLANNLPLNKVFNFTKGVYLVMVFAYDKQQNLSIHKRTLTVLE